MGLRAGARGLFAAEAAVELLIGHGCWLTREDFVDGFVDVAPGLADDTPMAWVNWLAAVAALDAGQLACCSSEAQLLRVAASIAEGTPVGLRDSLCGLDGHNLMLVAAAVLHAGGDRRAVGSTGPEVGR